MLDEAVKDFLDMYGIFRKIPTAFDRS
jgi:hypothetical protein